ncbi:hypothetical protein [Blautia massiliensis (ex Liu et al. 2021)]|uniref:hypothetical protein n=1 Tax=Blautia massiliensis (ex Liu et al. 2021) TaxID=3062492 RepID=UPI003F8AA8C3
MKKIGIMADSHSGILKQEAEELDIHVLPMPFYLNGELFHEDLDMPEKYILWLPPAALRKLPQTGSHRSGKAFREWM